MLRLISAVKLIAVLLLIGSVLAPYAPLTQAQGPATNDVSILWDPGPRYRCYGVHEEHYDPEPQGYQANPLKETAECSRFLVPARADENCRSFGAIMAPNTATCPTWKFLTLGWYYKKTASSPTEFRTYPGYDVGVTGGNGAPISAKLVNNARLMPDCALREVAFAYEYPASSFVKFRPDGVEYSLDDGNQLLVDYDVTISNVQGYSCPERRSIVTTDFIYTYQGKKNVLSIVHFDPQGLANTDGVY